MAYSPAFQFYPKDFLADPNTIRMTPHDIGAYMLLIMECWDRSNRLPKDIEFLAEVCRMTVEEFEPLWNRRLSRCFKEKKTFYFHKRLAEEIEKQKHWKKDQSDRGKLGAEKRWSEFRKNKKTSEKISENSKENLTIVKPPEIKGLENGTAMPKHGDAMPKNASSTSSSSSSSIDLTPPYPPKNGKVPLEVFLGVVLTGVRQELGVKKLTKQKEAEWTEHGTLAFENDFTAQRFIECFSLLRKQPWRKYPVTAKTVSDSLPDLDRIREELGEKGDEILPSVDEIQQKRDEYRTVKTPPKLKAV